jgi:hypothetical protein
MRFPRRDDPTDLNDPDGQDLLNPVPRRLMRGLAMGAVMFAAAAAVVWVAGAFLQDRATLEGQTAMARDHAISPGPATTSAPTTR